MQDYFIIDARVILNLGRDSIKDTSTAILELVKNGFDADALNVEVDIYTKSKLPYIRIADNGHGMTKNEIGKNWLRIGYSEKRKNKISNSGRRKTGEKGIGRISTDRLGSKVELKSKTVGDTAGIEVNWNDFDVENKDISDVKIKILDNPTIKLPKKNGVESNSGTEIIITGLRQKWTKVNIDNLRNELSLLTPPFKDVEDFDVSLNTDVSGTVSGKIRSDLLQQAEIELNAYYAEKEDEIIYSVKDKYNQDQNPKIEVKKISQILSSDDKELVKRTKLECGPLDIKLLFYPRTASLLEGTDFKLSDLRTFLDVHAGVKIYRDNIAVKPYGFTEEGQEDWLGLASRKAMDPAGVSRKTYKITPNQLVGAIFISRDKNVSLVDSASREGLIESDAFYDLKRFTLACIMLLESYRHNLLKNIEKKPRAKKSFSEKINSITSELTDVKTDLTDIKLGKYPDIKEPLENNIVKVDHAIVSTEVTFDEYLNEKRVIDGLATLGISTAVFGHEIESALVEYQDATTLAKEVLEQKKPEIPSAIEELDKAIKYAKQVSSWGSFALARVEYGKRKFKLRRIKNIIDNIVKEVQQIFKDADIELIANTETVVSKTYEMDIESIVLNLLTNAYTTCLAETGERKTVVKLIRDYETDLKGYYIVVADSGSGIIEENIDRIWEPFFSTKINPIDKKQKRAGTGLGLTIVKSIVDEMKGHIKVKRNNGTLKGAEFSIWLPRIK